MNKFKDKIILSLLAKSPEEGISLALDIYGGAVKLWYYSENKKFITLFEGNWKLSLDLKIYIS